jgi:hypothetical protein
MLAKQEWNNIKLPSILKILISSSNLIKSSLKEKSASNKQHKYPKESTIDRKTDDTNGEDDLKIKNHENNENNKKLVIEMTTSLIQRNKPRLERSCFS